MRRTGHRRLILIAVALVAGTLASPAPPAAAVRSTFYVSPTSGSDSNPGGAGLPLRTLERAVQLAPSGSAIVLRSGVYHESVHIFRKDLDISAAPGASVVFDGARRVTEWVASGGRWYSPGWTTSLKRTSGPETMGAAPMAIAPDLAFRNGTPLRQVASLSELGPGTFFVDDAADRLWMGDDPRGQLVEASDLRWALWFNEAHGSSLSGVTVRRYATTKADMAAVRLYSDSMSMTDSTVTRNAFKGVSVMGADVRLERLVVRSNAYIGIHGHLSRNVVVRNSTVVGNNSERFDAVHSGSGIKFTVSSIIGVRDNYVADNAGVGIWTDLGATFVSVTGNLVERNSYSGILMELSGRVVVANNVVLDSGESGIWILETNDADVWHNAVYRNTRDIWVEDGPRTSDTADEIAMWDTYRVRLRNNAVGQGRLGSKAVIAVDDWTEKRSFQSMAVTSDHNLYWVPAGSTTKLARWARWPEPLAINTTIAGHRAATAQDANSRWSSSWVNPFARSPRDYDFRTPASLPLGAALGRRVALALGRETGERLPIGPLRWMAPSGDVPGVLVRS